MIISASARTDIPGYYSEWFFNRLQEGYVLVRNPYSYHQVTKYKLDSDVVDSIVFWTKNPYPMLNRLRELKAFHPYFFVTITPYGRDVEENVPDYKEVVESFKRLYEELGPQAVCWRYDPIFLSDKYTIKKHEEAFEEIASILSGFTKECVVSFVDLYDKTKRNFKGIKEVSKIEQIDLMRRLSKIGKSYGIQIKTCAEKDEFEMYGVKSEGCISQRVVELLLDSNIIVGNDTPKRVACKCVPNKDIGSYNTCLSGCRYCYANYDKEIAKNHYKMHDVNSPLLFGNLEPEDVIHKAKQISLIDNQLKLRLE